MPLITKKPFRDCNRKMLERGETIKKDNYDEQTIKHYVRVGLIEEGQAKKQEPTKNKAAKPKEDK